MFKSAKIKTLGVLLTTLLLLVVISFYFITPSALAVCPNGPCNITKSTEFYSCNSSTSRCNKLDSTGASYSCQNYIQDLCYVDWCRYKTKCRNISGDYVAYNDPCVVGNDGSYTFCGDNIFEFCSCSSGSNPSPSPSGGGANPTPTPCPLLV